MKVYTATARAFPAARWDGREETWRSEFAAHGYVMSRVDTEAGPSIVVRRGDLAADPVAIPGDWLVEVGPSVFEAMSGAAFRSIFGV